MGSPVAPNWFGKVSAQNVYASETCFGGKVDRVATRHALASDSSHLASACWAWVCAWANAIPVNGKSRRAVLAGPPRQLESILYHSSTGIRCRTIAFQVVTSALGSVLQGVLSAIRK